MNRSNTPWINNIILYCDSAVPGNCPMCGSQNVQVTTHITSRISLSFTCNTCGASDHFDGVTILNDKHSQEGRN